MPDNALSEPFPAGASQRAAALAVRAVADPVPTSDAKVPGLVPVRPVELVQPAGNADGWPVSNVQRPITSARAEEVAARAKAKTDPRMSLEAMVVFIISNDLANSLSETL